MSLSRNDRIQGCLIGAAIGAELGFSRCIRPERFALAKPDDVFNVTLDAIGEYEERTGRIDARSAYPFIDVAAQAYLAKQGRVTPEDYAVAFKDHKGIAGPVFAFDGAHSTQEVLKEGMNPRISGFGNAPNGLIAAGMPAVGIFHFADPEYAYLDGVELASVAQPRLGADWAGLCAAGVAAAFIPDATASTVLDSVLKIAHQNDKELFYQLNSPAKGGARYAIHHPAEFVPWWVQAGGRGDGRKEVNWIGTNPMQFVLPLLEAFGNDPRKFFALLITPSPAAGYDAWIGGHAISAIIGGAIIGALYGAEVFPQEWRTWAEPMAKGWFGLTDVVSKRVEKESEIVSVTERLMAMREDGISLIEDKVYGCILAGAIGNAMGSPVEGRFYWEIDEKHPNGITGILNPGALESEDDNQMAMLLVETYLEREGLPVMARHFGKTWYERLNRDHFFALCMGHAYDMIREGWDPRITGHWSVTTGSTVMCMEPVGVYHLADPEFAAIDATAVSYMYQRGLDNLAATMLAATTAAAMHPDATVDSILQAGLDAAPKTKLLTFDERSFNSAYDYIAACIDIGSKYDDVFSVRKELYDKCLLYHQIDPLELWGFSLAMLKVANGDVRLSAVGGTNIGRDSDTIAGRAAMLSGTLRGAGNVPAEWIALFKPEVLAKIRRNAKRFSDVITDGKLARLRTRQGV